jgi:hypothetical protein
MSVLSKHRILVVEDEALIAFELEETIKNAGGVVAGPFATVDEALRLIENENISAAILDMQLWETRRCPSPGGWPTKTSRSCSILPFGQDSFIGHRRNHQKACDIGDIGQRTCGAYRQELHATHPLAMMRSFDRSLVCEMGRCH